MNKKEVKIEYEYENDKVIKINIENTTDFPINIEMRNNAIYIVHGKDGYVLNKIDDNAIAPYDVG